MSLAVIDSSHQVSRFDPTKYRIRQAACDYGIAEAKRIRDWPALEQAVDAKIAEQTQFIAWWYANVTVNHGGNRQKQVSGTRYLSYREAERLTGMKQPRVSELRSWLQHPDEYRSRLLGAAYRAAMLVAIPTYRLCPDYGRYRNESYTPPEWLEPVRGALGGEIDLDVASCELAQKNVQAKRFCTISNNALVQDWYGRVFCNPPYSHPEIVHFVDKLLHEIARGHTSAAILLTNNSTETAWFQRAAAAATAICFPRGRIHFISCDGTNQNAPVQGQAFFYFGDDVPAFVQHFGGRGVVR